VFGAGSYYILALIGKGPDSRDHAYATTAVSKPPIVRGWSKKREANMFSFERFLTCRLSVWPDRHGGFLYVLLDGFDLGVGILFPFAPSEQCRDRMMNSIAPFWDAMKPGWCWKRRSVRAFPLAYALLIRAVHPGAAHAQG